MQPKGCVGIRVQTLCRCSESRFAVMCRSCFHKVMLDSLMNLGVLLHLHHAGAYYRRVVRPKRKFTPLAHLVLNNHFCKQAGSFASEQADRMQSETCVMGQLHPDGIPFNFCLQGATGVESAH